MVCNVIDECRCYGYSMKEQFCGVRRGPNVLPCPNDCCTGGCPTKYPFRIIPRPKPPKHVPSLRDMDMKVLMFFTIILACIFLLLL
jgi:hypothetical protein